MLKLKSFFLFLGLLIVSGCVFEPGAVKVDLKQKNAISKSAISSVVVVNNQIKVTGSGLSGVTALKIKNNNLNESFTIESVSATQIIANATHAVTIGVGQVFDLILSNAHGAATFPVSFSLDNGSVTAVMLSSMGASAGQILKYNGSAWVPSTISSSQLYIGTWNASTNTPNLNLTTPQAGDYYVVTTAGTQGAITYAVGDWIISNGLSWSKLSHSSSVVGSFNGRTGLVVPEVGDYTWAQITKTGSKLEEIADVDITSRADQKVLKWDDLNSKWIMGNDNTGAGAPGPGSITTTEILDGTIANVDLAGSIAQSKITNLTSDLASKLGLTSLSATAPLVYNNTTGVFSINNASAVLDGAMSAADKTKLNGLEALSAGNGVLERFSGTLRSNTCADGEILKWVTLTGWTCSPDTSTDATKQTILSNSAGLAAALSDETGTGLAVFGTAPVITNPDIQGELRIAGSTSGYVGFVPAAVAGATTYKLPATQGTAGQVLSTDGVATNATLTWANPTTNSTGILDGTIVNADINAGAAIDYSKLNVPNAAIPLTALNATGTKDGTKYLKGDNTWATFSSDLLASTLSALPVVTNAVISTSDTVLSAFARLQKQITDLAVSAVGGDLSGTLPNPTVIKIRGTAVSATAPTSGNFFKYDGSNWLGSPITIADIKSLSVGNLFPASACAANQTLSYALLVDAFTCVDIGTLDGAKITTGTIDVARLPASAGYWVAATGGINYAGGNVGIGTSVPTNRLTVKAISNTVTDYPIQMHNLSDTMRTGHGTYGISNKIGTAQNIDYTYDIGGAQIFNTGGTERLRILGTGNVGIGTATPAQKLEVNGGIKLGYGEPTAPNTTASGLSFDGDTGIFAAADGQLNLWSNNVRTMALFGPNVGIGVTTPTARLEISANTTMDSVGATAGIRIYNSQSANNDYLNIGWLAEDTFGLQSADAANNLKNLILNPFGGNVGIGTNVPSEALEVNGKVKATAFLYTSDRRLKKDIHTLPDTLAKILKLRGVSFKWNSNDEKTIGFIAQEVEKIYPELVTTDAKSGYKAVQYGNIVAILVEALKQEHEERVKDRYYFETQVDLVSRSVASVNADNEERLQKLEKENLELKEKLLKIEAMLLKK